MPWPVSNMLEVTLPHPQDFLKTKETLTRIGTVVTQERKTLKQICHIFHKQGRYYIVHYLEMLALDGRCDTIPAHEILRRNRIASLLTEWKLVIPVEIIAEVSPMSSIKVVPFSQKKEWTLVSEYTIGVYHD